MKKTIKYKTREEWLANRTQGIGASEAGTVLGLNPWESPYMLWRRKKGLDAPKEENFAMKAGHYLEDAVSRFYADETGAYIIKNTTEDFTILDTERPWLRVSPDRLFWREGATKSDKHKSVLECKTTQIEIDPDNLPKHWFCQLQMNMGVGEYDNGALAWLTMGRQFGYRDISFDKEFYDWMTGEISEYWKKYIVGNEEPPISTPDDVLVKYPRHKEGKEVEATEEIMQMILRLKELNGEIKPKEAEKKDIEASLKLFFGDAETIVSPSGNVIATWKAPKATMQFDKKLFESQVPEDERAKWYKEVQGARRLLIK